MYILGISCFYHDSSATLLKDGKVVAAVEEERFTRKKHDTSFPINAINYCLESNNLKIDDINYIGFYEKPFLKFERLLSQYIDKFPMSWRVFCNSLPSWITEKLRVVRIIKKKLNYKGDILFIDHHLAHAASAFLPSPFKKAAILTVDGVGEWTTTAYGVGEDEEIILKKQIEFPSSLGLLYSTITAYLGFSVNNSEYKVMGLSPYGDRNKETNHYYSKLKKVIDIKEDGSYKLNKDYFSYTYKNKMPSKKMCELLGGPITKADTIMGKRHKDIAAALQVITEEVMTKMLNHLYKVTQCENLVLAGGVALNSVYNGKILRETPFKNLWIQPNASDGGTSMGAAYYIYNSILKQKRGKFFDNAYTGPTYSNEEIKEFLDKNKIKYFEFKTRDQFLKTVSQLIFKNKVIGWFQKGMEWGPRALGSRSILSNPCEKNMQEILNLKVKHREKFRPFAPAVCVDDALKYFDCDSPIPYPTDYMLMVYPVREEWREKIPSVTHVDGSGRLQSVRRDQNHLYYDLIKEFGKLSGIPILINTSFNIRGEPIVCTPYDSYKCMMGTGIDYLVIGKYLVKRDENLKDAWDSEKFAVD
jgi:carbamoyltransferase